MVSSACDADTSSQPRSGERIQPTAQAVSNKWEMTQPQRGERIATTQTPQGPKYRSLPVHRRDRGPKTISVLKGRLKPCA